MRTNIDTTSLRKITRKELHVEKQTLGRGMFGRCYLARLGPLQVCVKVFRREKQYVSTFAMEALLLSKLCHENIPWLHGIVSENTVPKMIIQSFHCYTQDAKQYHLTATQQCLYEHNHPQVAPDLRDGLCKQSKLSDVYSFGRVMDSVNKKSLNLPVLCSLSSQCTEYLQTKRPTTSKLFMFLKNLLSE